MKLPNFLIIGSAKSGTTALYEYLKQHPQIYMSPIKEPKFFMFEGEKIDFCGPGDREAHSKIITDIESYSNQFQGVTNEISIGEASPFYIYSPKACERIHYYIPDAKLIAILRNPVDRAYSNFLHLIRDVREPQSNFAQALKEEQKRIQSNWEPIWHYKQLGFYSTQLKRYFNLFNRNQIKVYLHEDLKSDPNWLFQDIFNYLNVDEKFIPNISVRHNISGMPKDSNWQTFLMQPHFTKSLVKNFIPSNLREKIKDHFVNKNLSKSQVSLEIREQLVSIYRDDILNLQDLIQRDLSEWLK